MGHNSASTNNCSLMKANTCKNRGTSPKPDIIFNDSRLEHIGHGADGDSDRRDGVVRRKYPAMHGDQTVFADENTAMAIDYNIRANPYPVVNNNTPAPWI